MSKKGIITSVLAILFVLIILCVCCLSFFMVASAIGEIDTESTIKVEKLTDSDSSDEIVIIDIEGMIASTSSTVDTGELDMVDIILKKLEKAQADENVKAIVIRLNTPGGTVHDSHIIAQKIKEVNAEKPVISLMTMSATSGGYYVAAPTTKIIASETTVTGSIGVIVRITDLDGLYEKLGVEMVAITNTQGNVKSMDNVEDPNSDDRKVLEEILDDNFESFINEIIEGRNLSREEVLELADGSIYSGKKAKELKLVDELGGYDKAIQTAKEAAGIEDADIIEYNTYVDPFSSFSLLAQSKLNPLKPYTDKINPEPGMYMYYLPE